MMNRRTGLSWDTRSLVWSAAILAGSAGFFVLVARPQAARARELRQTVENERASMAARYQSLQAISALEKQVADISARTADFEQRLPDQNRLGNFLEDLARVAQKHNLYSDAIQPGEAVRMADAYALPITVKVRGSFSGVHGLLRDIEQMPRLTRIDQFSSIADEEHPGQVTVEMILKVFYRTPEQGVAGR